MAIPVQERSVDPYSSYDSNVVNKLTRIISNGENVLLLPTPPTAEKTDVKEFDVIGGKAIIQDVLIETEDHHINMSDIEHYVDGSTGVYDEDGIYYLIMAYQYAKTSPPPEASILIIKPSQLSTLYDPETHLFINALEIETISTVREIVGIHNFDPNNIDVKRGYASGGGGSSSGSSVNPNTVTFPGPYNVTTDDDTLLIDTTDGSLNVILPLVTTTDKIVRIVKIKEDNMVTISPSAGDSIEGQMSIVLNSIYESVVLMPIGDNLWIQL